MDRVQNYNLQTPLTADDLNKERDYTAIALGKIVSALLGQGTVVSDLAATAVASTTVPTLQLSDGQLYELATLDPTAFGSLPVNSFPSTANVMKQGLLLASRGDANTFELTPPGTSGESIIYLLEAQYADLDADTQTITFYNVSDPTNPTTATQPRVREGTISFVLKAGIASSSPTAPSADAGYVPLYNIEVAYGQTVLLQSDISVYPGAPFLSQKLFGLMNGSGTVDVPALTASGLIMANDGIDVTAGVITAGGGLTIPSGETLSVDGTITIPNATASNQPVALGQQPLLATAYFHAQEQQPSTVAGGTNIVGVNIRVLNTILTNTISGASLASNQVTLPAGSYYVRASAPAYACGEVKLSLYNVSTSAYLLIGTAEIASNSAKSFVSGIITLASTQTLELSMYCTGGPQNGSGLGYPTDQPGIVEVYSDIEIWQLG